MWSEYGLKYAPKQTTKWTIVKLVQNRSIYGYNVVTLRSLQFQGLRGLYGIKVLENNEWHSIIKTHTKKGVDDKTTPQG